jgi:septal ring factor EnvC (AmiA/AmiB activator)
MADSFGFRLGIEGEREFKKALSEINQSFKVLGSEMNLVNSQFDKNDNSIKALTARKTVLNREIDEQRQKVSTLEAALSNAAKSFGENDSRTKSWQTQLNNAQAELNGMERELERNDKALENVGDEMKSTGKETDKLGSEVDATGREAEKAGGKFEKLGGVLKGVGVAIGAAMAAIGTTAIACGKALFDMGMATSDTANEIDKMSQKMGLSRQGYQEWKYILDQNGKSIENLTGSFKYFQVGLFKTGDDAKKMEKNLEKLGLSLADLQRMSTEDAYETLIKAFQGMEEGAEKSALAVQLLGGRYGVELLPMLNSTAEEMDELRQRAHELGAVLSDDVVDAGVHLNNSMTDLRTAFRGVKNSIGAELLPGLASIVVGLTGVMTGSEDAAEGLTAGVEQMVTGMKNALPRLLNMIGNIVAVFAQIVPAVVSTIIQGLTENLPKLAQAAIDMVQVLLGGIIQSLPELAAAGTRIIVHLVSGIGDALPHLVPAAVQAILTVASTIIMMLPELVAVGMRMMSKLAEGLGNAIPLLKPVTIAISAVIDVVQALAPYLAAAAAGFAAFYVVSTVTSMLQGMTVATTASTIAATAKAIALKVVTAAQWLWNAAMAANPIGLVIAGVAALTAGIAVLVTWLNKESEALRKNTESLIKENNRLNESIAETSRAFEDRQRSFAADAGAASSLADKIAELSRVENKSAQQKQQLAAYVSMLNEAMGESVLGYDAETDAMSRNIGEIYSLIEARQQEAMAQAARERAVEIAKEQMAVEEQLQRLERQRVELDEAFARGTIIRSTYWTETRKLNDSEAELIARQDELVDSFEYVTQVVTEAAEAQRAANEAIAASAGEVTDALTLANEIQAELAQERVERERAVTEEMLIAASEQGLSLDEYKKKLEDTQKEEERIYREREATLDKYTKAATDMFNRLNNESKVTVRDMTDTMRHNQQVLETWADNVAALAERGIDRGLLDTLRAAGPQSAGTVAALVAASDKELEELSDVFASGAEVATSALLRQLGLPDVVSSGSDMVDEISQGVESNDSLINATERLMQDARRTAETAVRDGGYNTVGAMIVDGVHRGIRDREAWFRSQVTAFFRNIVNDVKSELGIRSPSSVFAGIGSFMAQGLGIGFTDRMNRVARDMQSAIPQHFSAPSQRDAGSNSRARRGIGEGTTINQTMTVTTPRAFSERELVREFSNMSKKLALGV